MASKKLTEHITNINGPQSLADLKPAPYNPRKITGEALAGLKTSIAQFGDISGITWNKRTGYLVAGHQRLASLKALYGDKLQVLPDRIVCPDGSEFTVRVVDWDEAQEKAANVAANNPHIAGEFDETIDALLGEIREADAALFDGLRLGNILPDVSDLLGSGEGGDGSTLAESQYTMRIKPPIYEPKGPCPDIKDLLDSSEATAMIDHIKAQGLPKDVEAFLVFAAYRHVVFDYRNIAEFYCHQSEDVQALMEDSGLVIVDSDKAIERGFLKLSDSIYDQLEAEHGTD